MDSDPATPTSGPERDDARVAAVRHVFRNQIQAMTSLVGLFGRTLPPGDGRDAFMDLRARFEAATFAPPDDATPDAEGRFSTDLVEIARRVVGHLDPDHRHRLHLTGAPAFATPKRAAALSQILAELVIDLVRNGFADGRPGAAEIEVAPTADGGVSIHARQTGPTDAAPRRQTSDLGLAIADSLVRSLGGTASRASEGPLSTQVAIPPENARR